MASSLTVFPISAFSDNYIWCIHDGCHAVVVDPGDATPVLQALKEHELRLDAILITHHHADHTGGITTLQNHFNGLPVIGPNNPRIKGLTNTVQDGDTVKVGNFSLELNVLEVPGHTLDHIAFHTDTMLFCGDTLFSAGCGRLFEGTPEQMWQSLQKLTALPDSIAVYCTHEYTMSNLSFAAAAEPHNLDIKDTIETVKQLRETGLPSLPTSLQVEKAINPFLRADIDAQWAFLTKQTHQTIHSPVEAFAALRSWKDNF